MAKKGKGGFSLSQLRQPYRCMCRGGIGTLLAALICIPIGIVLLVYFDGKYKSDKFGERIGAYAGMVLLVGGFILLLLGIILCCCLHMCFKKQEKTENKIQTTNIQPRASQIPDAVSPGFPPSLPEQDDKPYI